MAALLLAVMAASWTSTAQAGSDNTPPDLPGAAVVDAQTLAALQAQGGVRLVDTRALHDFLAGHLPGAYHVDYRERSARTTGFDAAEDESAAFLRRLLKFVQPHQPVVFYCNGPACWKSYKAAAVARDAGYRQVHWFRGGMAEWRQNGMAVVAE